MILEHAPAADLHGGRHLAVRDREFALEEVEKSAGKTFAREAVRALRVVAGRPEVAAPAKVLKVG